MEKDTGSGHPPKNYAMDNVLLTQSSSEKQTGANASVLVINGNPSFSDSLDNVKDTT